MAEVMTKTITKIIEVGNSEGEDTNERQKGEREEKGENERDREINVLGLLIK